MAEPLDSNKVCKKVDLMDIFEVEGKANALVVR
jgi:hypothetical protein